MGCCLSTEYQVDLVIAKFSKYYSQFTNLQANEFPQLVAGRILPVSTVLFAPVSGKRCVYYTVKAEELVHKTRQHIDDNGNSRVDHYTEWEYRYTDTKCVDFLLVDPANPSVTVYIPFSQTNHKLHCKTDTVNTEFQQNQNRPDCLSDMFSRYGNYNHRGTQWRYYESSFEFGEQVAVLGVIRDAQNLPGGKMLNPMTTDILTEEYFKQNEWSSWDKSSWKDLTQQACIIVTDVPAFLKDKPIAPLAQNYSAPTFQHPMYITGYTPVVSPPPQQQFMQNRVFPDPGMQQQQGMQMQQMNQGGYPQQQGGMYPQQQQQQYSSGGMSPQQVYPMQQMQQQQMMQQGGGYPQQQQMNMQYPQQQQQPGFMLKMNAVHPHPGQHDGHHGHNGYNNMPQEQGKFMQQY